MKMTNLTNNINRLNTFFHEDFINLQSTFRKNETINWVANCGFSHNYYDYGFVKVGFGYVVLTSLRIFTVGFSSRNRFKSPKRTRVCYYQYDKPGLLDRLVVGDIHNSWVANNFYTVLPPTSPLTDDELTMCREVTDVFSAKLTGVKRQNYTFLLNTKQYTFVSVTPEFEGKNHFNGPLLYDIADGNELYEILFDLGQQNTAQKNIPSVTAPIDIAEHVKKLKELYQYQVLTENEYRAAMERLGIKIEE
jgi:hypothetical protein